MTDDSSAERNALRQVWPHALLLLSKFHFLQCKWTWLHNGANRIANQDHQILISKTKQLVYAKSESMLELSYKQFKECKIVKNSQITKCSLSLSGVVEENGLFAIILIS